MIAAKAAELGISVGTRSIPILLDEINAKLTQGAQQTNVCGPTEDDLLPPLQRKILSTMLPRWFMTPLQGKAKEWCRLGHEAEGLLVSNLAIKFKKLECVTDL